MLCVHRSQTAVLAERRAEKMAILRAKQRAQQAALMQQRAAQQQQMQAQGGRGGGMVGFAAHEPIVSYKMEHL